MGNSYDVLTADPPDDLTVSPNASDSSRKVLADIVGIEHVSADSHFFDDLGADSMLMARSAPGCAKRADLPSVSMPDVYQHPTSSESCSGACQDVAIADPADDLTGLAGCERLFAQVLADIVGHRARVG
jgi:hypothetical protein